MSQKQSQTTKKWLLKQLSEQKILVIRFTKLDGTDRRLKTSEADPCDFGDDNHITVKEMGGDWKTIIVDRIYEVTPFHLGSA